MTTLLHLIGVSAGDATLVEHIDGDRLYHILIDGGLNKRTTVEYLLNRDIRRLDLVVASHLDYDHLAGLLDVFTEPSISIGEFWTFDINILRSFLETGEIPQRKLLEPRHVMRFLPAYDIQRQCEIQGILCRQVAAGHIARFGGLVFEVLYPSQEYLDYLYNPRILKVILQRSRIPLGWKIGKHEHKPEQVSEEGKRKPHHRIRWPREETSRLREWETAARGRWREWTSDDDQALKPMSSYWHRDRVPLSDLSWPKNVIRAEIICSAPCDPVGDPSRGPDIRYCDKILLLHFADFGV